MTNIKDRAEYLNMRPFKCPHCEGIHGTTTDNILFIGAARYRKVNTFECGYCEKMVRWRPKNDSFEDSK